MRGCAKCTKFRQVSRWVVFEEVQCCFYGGFINFLIGKRMVMRQTDEMGVDFVGWKEVYGNFLLRWIPNCHSHDLLEDWIRFWWRVRKFFTVEEIKFCCGSCYWAIFGISRDWKPADLDSYDNCCVDVRVIEWVVWKVNRCKNIGRIDYLGSVKRIDCWGSDGVR